MDGVVKRLKRRVGNTDVYISVDIDVLDPAFAPATGTAISRMEYKRDAFCFGRSRGRKRHWCDCIRACEVIANANAAKAGKGTLMLISARAVYRNKIFKSNPA